MREIDAASAAHALRLIRGLGAQAIAAAVGQARDEKKSSARTDLVSYARSIEVPGRPIPSEDGGAATIDLAPHHILILEAIQRTIQNPKGYGRLMIMCPPGSAKSTYASVVAPTWYLGGGEERRIIIASYGDDLARKNSFMARSICRSDEFREIYNQALTKEAADEWCLGNGSMCIARGILSGITGHRADGIIIDDPVKGAEAADSPTIRGRVLDEYRNTLLTRLKPRGWLIIIATRWHHEDLIGQLLPPGYSGESGMVRCTDGRNWEILRIPAEADHPTDPLGRAPGEMLWPEWFDSDHWALHRASARTWNSLFQQSPTPDIGSYFEAHWFRWYRTPPPSHELTIYGCSDYAVTEKGGDWTVHLVWGVTVNDDLYLLDYWRERTSPDKWVVQLCEMADKWQPYLWIEEAGQIRSGVGPFLTRELHQRRVYMHREAIPAKADKSQRAQGFRGRASQGKVYLPDVDWAHQMLSRMMLFPRTSIDDEVDACSLIGLHLDEIKIPRMPTPKPARAKPGSVDWLLKVTRPAGAERRH